MKKLIFKLIFKSLKLHYLDAEQKTGGLHYTYFCRIQFDYTVNQLIYAPKKLKAIYLPSASVQRNTKRRRKLFTVLFWTFRRHTTEFHMVWYEFLFLITSYQKSTSNRNKWFISIRNAFTDFQEAFSKLCWNSSRLHTLTFAASYGHNKKPSSNIFTSITFGVLCSETEDLKRQYGSWNECITGGLRNTTYFFKTEYFEAETSCTIKIQALQKFTRLNYHNKLKHLKCGD